MNNYNIKYKALQKKYLNKNCEVNPYVIDLNRYIVLFNRDCKIICVKHPFIGRVVSSTKEGVFVIGKKDIIKYIIGGVKRFYMAKVETIIQKV